MDNTALFLNQNIVGLMFLMVYSMLLDWLVNAREGVIPLIMINMPNLLIIMNGKKKILTSNINL